MKKMKKAGFLVGLCLVLVQTSNAQTLKDAIKLTENHQFEAASKMFHELITKTPTDAHLYYYMGENMWKGERFDSAAWYYDKGIATDPNIGLNYVGKGKIALSKNDEATAKPLFEKALTHHTNDGKAYMAIAEAYIDNDWKNMTYAIECLSKAEKLEHTNPNVYLLIGKAALLGSNDGLTALNNYEKARDMDPKNPKPLIFIGELYERARSYDLAFAEYNKAISLDTTFAPSYYKLGDLYYQYGDNKNAAKFMKKYADLSKSLSARVKYAKYLFLAKEYDAALFEFEDITAIDPSINILNRLKAYSQYELKMCAEALKSIELFLKNAPTSGDKIIADDHRYYGKILSCNKMDSLAIPQFMKALEMDSTKLDVYGALADSYSKTKKYDEAVNVLQRKFKLVKEPAVGDIFKIGQAFYFKGVAHQVSYNAKKKADKNAAGLQEDSLAYSQLFIKADSCFAIVTSKQPEGVIGHVYRGKANAGLDPDTKQGLAKPHYESVIALGSLEVEKNKKYLIEAHYYLAYYYFLVKDKANAIINVDKVIEYDPTNTNAPNLKKFIEKLP
jgi:tetratricopeptide (TPR) repeat protein